MTNHIHLLLERQSETIGSIMQRILGGYSRYYNRRYKHIGHVFQGRHKSMCQSDRYLFGLSEDKFCGPEKSAKAVLAKEVLILIGRECGAAVTELSLIAGLDTSNISRRHDVAREKLQTDRKLAYARDQVEEIYLAKIAESHL